MFAARHIPYNRTNAFTKIVLDYLSGSGELKPFYSLPPTVEGFRQIIDQRKAYPTNRKVLVDCLQEQYETVVASESVKKNIQALLSPDSFTVCTAHQPNLF